MELEQWRAAPGTLLAAWPDLADPNFSRSVVLLCQHDARGAYGLVINRPLGLDVDKLVPEHPLLGQLRTPVYLGGPVDHSRLQFLHQRPADIPGGREISAGIFLGGEIEALARCLEAQDLARGQDPAGIRLFLGYSGWGAGQLEGELLGGSWVPALLDKPLVFSAHDEAAWLRVVRSVEGGTELIGEPDGVDPN